jgi:hypothetical protein
MALRSARAVLLIALLAMSRKFVILDTGRTQATTIAALGAVSATSASTTRIQNQSVGVRQPEQQIQGIRCNSSGSFV